MSDTDYSLDSESEVNGIIRQLRNELAAKTAECAELRKDADRYRALRHWNYAQDRLVQHWPIWGPGTQYPDSANVVDAVVDSFMIGKVIAASILGGRMT